MRLPIVMVVLAACGSYDYSAFHADKPAPRSILAQRAALEASTTSAQLSSRRTNDLSREVAVRHRRLDSSLEWKDIIAVIPTSLFAGTTPQTPTAQLVAGEQPVEPEKLVVEAWIDLQADDVTKVVGQLRARVAADGGRVVSETVQGAEHTASSAAMEIRVPPAKAAAFTGWLGGLGVVESSRTLASDVGKQLIDQELELANLRITMKRLQALAERDVPMQALLELEKEMTRVRGEIEHIEGERRWLLDRVDFATITLNIKREGEPIELASTDVHVHPGPHVVVLSLLDPGDRTRTHVGGGVTLHVTRALTFDLDVFPRRGGDTRIVTTTIGSALYSGMFGGGGRAMFNPYLGARLGYGYLSGSSALVLAGELGLELYKQRYLLVETSVRATELISGNHGDTAFIGQLGLEVPF